MTPDGADWPADPAERIASTSEGSCAQKEKVLSREARTFFSRACASALSSCSRNR